MKTINFFNYLYKREIRIQTSFSNLRNLLIKSKNNHFAKGSVSKDSFQFDYMDDNFYSRNNLNRFKLMNVISNISFEENESTLIIFRLKKGVLIFYPAMITFLISIPFWEGFLTLVNFIYLTLFAFVFILILFKLIFNFQFEKLQIDIDKLLKENK